MKIKSIETLRVAIPADADGPTGDNWAKVEALILRIETGEGLVGWGEAFGHAAIAVTEAALKTMIAPWFIGKEVDDIEKLMQMAQRAFHTFGRGGPVLYALSGIDIALWDIAAKRAGQPLFRLLGGNDGRIKLYASLLPYNANADAIQRNSRKARDLGFAIVKLHETTIPAFMAARESIEPSVPVALDVNCPWTADEAREMARAIKGRGFHWLEEPVWPPENFAGLAAVRREGVPIAGGENVGTPLEFQRAFEAGAFDIAQPSVTKIGGISVMRRVGALADARGVRVIPHCFYWGPGYLATAHFAAARPDRPPVETMFVKFAARPYPLLDTGKGELALPESPGLGFEPDQAVIANYLVSRASIT